MAIHARILDLLANMLSEPAGATVHDRHLLRRPSHIPTLVGAFAIVKLDRVIE
jgi:hypothetical protein